MTFDSVGSLFLFHFSFNVAAIMNDIVVSSL